MLVNSLFEPRLHQTKDYKAASISAMHATLRMKSNDDYNDVRFVLDQHDELDFYST
jgi:hypothetical protein